MRAGAEFAEVRGRYLKLALQLHPDKGSNDAEHFRAVQEAYETMRGHAPEARRRMEAARREAGGAATGDGGGEETEAEGEEELERAEAAEAEAMEEAAAAAESAARPREWVQLAMLLKEAAAIYYREWHAFQREVQRKRLETAKGEGYDTHAERRAAQARQRTEQRRAEREAADAAALEALRQERERDKAELRERRQQEETRLRELGGRALSDAIEADWTAVATGYIVKVPWTMWCRQRCTCGGGPRKCVHRDSDAYTDYVIREVHGSGEDMTLQVERAGRTDVEKREGPRRDGTTWNTFTLTWRAAAGIERYGKNKQGVRIEPRAAADGTQSDGAESEPDEEELEMPRAEMRQARQHMKEAMAASREADQTEGAQEETAEAEAAREGEEEGAAQQDGREGGSGDAEEEEEEEGGRSGGEQEEGEKEEARRAERGAAGRGADRGKRAAVAAGRARAGKNWWNEGWMGPVAASEYAESWGREGMEGRRRPEHYVANMQGAENATRLGRVAARGAAAEARRRGEAMEWTGAAAVAAEDEAEGVKQVEGAAKGWRTRNEQGAARRDTQYGETAARAAAQMRKEAPTAGPEAEMGRTAATRAVAQVMEAMKIGAEAGKRVEEAEVDEGYAKAAEEMGLQEEGQARRQLRMMVEAVMKAQSEGEVGMPTTQAPMAQTRPTAQTETRAAGGEGQQREETDEMKKRRQRFEREAEKPLPPLPLFGEGPQGARRTQAGGNVTKVQATVARIRKLIDSEEHGTQKRVGLEALLRRRLAEGSDESGGGGENGGGGAAQDKQKRANSDETIQGSSAAAGGDDADDDDGDEGGGAGDDDAIETPTIGSGAAMGGDSSARAAGDEARADGRDAETNDGDAGEEGGGGDDGYDDGGEAKGDDGGDDDDDGEARGSDAAMEGGEASGGSVATTGEGEASGGSVAMASGGVDDGGAGPGLRVAKKTRRSARKTKTGDQRAAARRVGD